MMTNAGRPLRRGSVCLLETSFIHRSLLLLTRAKRDVPTMTKGIMSAASVYSGTKRGCFQGVRLPPKESKDPPQHIKGAADPVQAVAIRVFVHEGGKCSTRPPSVKGICLVLSMSQGT